MVKDVLYNLIIDGLLTFEKSIQKVLNIDAYVGGLCKFLRRIRLGKISHSNAEDMKKWKQTFTHKTAIWCHPHSFIDPNKHLRYSSTQTKQKEMCNVCTKHAFFLYVLIFNIGFGADICIPKCVIGIQKKYTYLKEGSF